MIAFHSDDFGYNPNIDNKIIDLIQKNKLSGISVISNLVKPQSLSKLSEIKDKTKVFRINLHANFIEGKSLAKKEEVFTLVNKKGHFYTKTVFFIRLLFGLINPDHIELETLKQLDWLAKNGIKIDTIDSHQHIHVLSPVAEIIFKIAKKYRLKIRSYQNIKTQSAIAKIKFFILKLSAFISHFIYYHKIGLPVTWQIPSDGTLMFLSWEENNFDVSREKNNVVIIIHPYLGFDTNMTYVDFLNLHSAK